MVVLIVAGGVVLGLSLLCLAALLCAPNAFNDMDVERL